MAEALADLLAWAYGLSPVWLAFGFYAYWIWDARHGQDQ